MNEECLDGTNKVLYCLLTLQSLLTDYEETHTPILSLGMHKNGSNILYYTNCCRWCKFLAFLLIMLASPAFSMKREVRETPYDFES